MLELHHRKMRVSEDGSGDLASNIITAAIKVRMSFPLSFGGTLALADDCKSQVA